MNKTVALESLRRTAEGIAIMFGSACETLIHDMAAPNHPILAIYNGHVSGRELGSKEDIFGSPVDADNTYIGKDYVNHLVVTPAGKYIKSSTFNFAGEDYHYALGINFDFTALVSSSKVLAELASVGTALDVAMSEVRETRLKDAFEEQLVDFGKPVEKLNKPERLALIAKLQQNNLFSYQKAVPFVAEKLHVSRYTVYKYIREIADNPSLRQNHNGESQRSANR